MSAEFGGVPEEVHGVVAPHRLCYQGLAGGTTGTELTSQSEWVQSCLTGTASNRQTGNTERDGRVARDTARTLTSLAKGKMDGATE